MIYALPGQPFTAVLQGAASGLVGTLGIRLEAADGTNLIPRTTAGIIESEAGSGVYVKADLVAPEEKGTYVVIWDTGGGSPSFASEELVVSLDLPSPAPPGSSAWTPSVSDVAALLQARLERRGGGKAETFDETTSPTATQVEALAAQAGRRVASSIGEELCDDAAYLADDARQAAAIYAAMLVEQSFYPEQTRNAGSSYQSLKSLWDDSIKSLTEAVGEICGGGDGSAVGGAGARPKGWFDSLPLIGRSGPEW